ncbi:MAG: bla [Francisellaceae bacterium]|nr:bla [Francisellaceae bacterium]
MKQRLNYFAKLILFSSLYFCIGNFNAQAGNNVSVMQQLKDLEASTEGRLGIFAINTENEHVIKYRSKEIFPLGCTSKTIGVAAVLKKSMSNPSLLSRNIRYSKDDLMEWSPITEKYISEGMTVQALCAASISLSDNTAMNLLLKSIGGIQGMNDFARSIGDFSFRQDNDWPGESFSGGVGNLKDSSTPQAMVESFRKLTMGKVLGEFQRKLLNTWLINTQTGKARIRSSIPKGWIVGNKTGTGSVYGSTNDLAIVRPPNHAPILIGIYYTSDNEKAEKREDIVSAVTKALIVEFIKNDKNLKGS